MQSDKAASGMNFLSHRVIVEYEERLYSRIVNHDNIEYIIWADMSDKYYPKVSPPLSDILESNYNKMAVTLKCKVK